MTSESDIKKTFSVELDEETILVSVNSLFDRTTQKETGDKQVDLIFEEVFKITKANPDKKFKLLGHLEDENLSNDIGASEEHLEKLFKHPQITHIAIVIGNRGGITLMNLLSKMITKKNNVRFFGDLAFAKNWLKEQKDEEDN